MTSDGSKSATPQPIDMDELTTDRAAPVASDAGPEIVAYRLSQSPPPLVCAPSARAWMDATPERFAYRCLPLLIANQAGWVVLNEHSFEVMWDGTSEQSGVHFRHLAKEAAESIVSHFGSGVVTWQLSYLFRTPPGYNLLVRGPSNSPKDGVQALEGLVETDWTYATFTMNWKLTRPDHWVRFDKGEPICMIIPQRRGELEAFRTTLRNLSDNPELAEGHRQWSASRSRFLVALRLDAATEKWQKHYFQGHSPQQGSTKEHQTVLNLRPFTAPNEQPVRRTAPPSPDRSVPPEQALSAAALRPCRRPDYFLQKRDDEFLLCHPTRAKGLELNEAASLIWELCNGQRTTAEITELLREGFPEAAATIGDDVESTLRMFAEHDAMAFIQSQELE